MRQENNQPILPFFTGPSMYILTNLELFMLFLVQKKAAVVQLPQHDNHITDFLLRQWHFEYSAQIQPFV